MKRVAVNILSFYLWLTAAANLLVTTGIADDWGVALPDSGFSKFHDAADRLDGLDAKGDITESIVNVALAGKETIQAVTSVLTAAPETMAALGVPEPLVVFIHAPLPLVTGMVAFYVATGREL